MEDAFWADAPEGDCGTCKGCRHMRRVVTNDEETGRTVCWVCVLPEADDGLAVISVTPYTVRADVPCDCWEPR
nr:hypothetical protein [uncultured Olsenella sp.]